MKICKTCTYFLDVLKELNPAIYDTSFKYDKCGLFYKIEPVRGLKVNASCNEARHNNSMCGIEGNCHETY